MFIISSAKYILKEHKFIFQNEYIFNFHKIFIKYLSTIYQMFEFQATIISWYHQNKRNLPWRGTTNPYFIWLSEIILQQTRIEQGT